MLRLSILFVVLLATAQPAGAQTDTVRDAAKQIPGALSDLIKSAYICKGVLGTDILNQSKDLATTELTKLGLDDYNTQMLVTSAEGAAQQTCGDANSCWRTLPGLSQASSELDGMTACNALIDARVSRVQALNKALGL